MHVSVPKKKKKNTTQQSRKRQEALGSVSRAVCYINLLYASRETSQRKNYLWKWVYADAGPKHLSK